MAQHRVCHETGFGIAVFSGVCCGPLGREIQRGVNLGLLPGRIYFGMTDARLWHPWLRINRLLRVMLHALERGGRVAGPGRFQAGACAAESDSARGVLNPDGVGTRGRRTVNVLPFRGPSLAASTVPL